MIEKYFIGIVPPKEVLIRIEQFQRRWVSELKVEPHITLKAQGGLTPDKFWISKVKEVCGNFKSFQVSLGEPSFFGDNILYLSINDSRLLHDLHHKIVQTIAPSGNLIKQYFEMEAYVPHLTIGKAMQGGLTPTSLKMMEEKAKKDLTPYPSFVVDFLRVYKLDVDKDGYEKLLDIPLHK
ncbi:MULTISPECIES: 2'-5' RNA ligase family protein [Bacillaceae]|uniref:2'-5' RNA ligase family protein n=1 Tax=Evansella alkalicola TaxID=745819 RepID=A0ABS6JZU2_9BACI|nr:MULTISPECIES: 2'-5' RNA ligase family protein [Bacillaceae]MBU9723209.1 2'-5' RNA ligase family protein [Bacillus alkalicola]